VKNKFTFKNIKNQKMTLRGGGGVVYKLSLPPRGVVKISLHYMWMRIHIDWVNTENVMGLQGI